MKKVLLIIAILAIGSGFVQAQNMDTVTFKINSSVAFSNISLSTPTGIKFGDGCTFHGEFSTIASYECFGLGVTYNGYYTIGGKMVNLTDMSCSYNKGNLSFTLGYEFIYNQYVGEQPGETSDALFAVASLEKSNATLSTIFFYNVKERFLYAIGSFDYKICDHVKMHSVIAYTTGEPYPVYGLLGLQAVNNRASVGFYATLRKGASGGVIEVKINLFKPANLNIKRAFGAHSYR